MGTWACVCSTAPRMCLAVCRSSINICWLLNLKSPGPWFPPPSSDHVPSSEEPSQVASPNRGGNTFGRNRADMELHSWAREGAAGATRRIWRTGSTRQNWVCSLGYQKKQLVRGSHFPPWAVLFTKATLSFPPSLFCSHLTSESQSITNLIPGTTIPNVEASQSWNTPTSEFPPIPQLHTFQTPIYISSTSVLLKEMHSSALLNKQ